MNLKHVFDALFDGILIVHNKGAISYCNEHATKLISEKNIDAISFVAVKRMLKMILDGELHLPVKHIEKSEDGTDYSIKIPSMYSLYIIQFVETKHPSDFHQIKRNAIRVIDDMLYNRLALLKDELMNILCKDRELS